MDDDSPFRNYVVPRIVSRNARVMWVAGIGEMGMAEAQAQAELLDMLREFCATDPTYADHMVEVMRVMTTCSQADRARLLAALGHPATLEEAATGLDRALALARILND